MVGNTAHDYPTANQPTMVGVELPSGAVGGRFFCGRGADEIS